MFCNACGTENIDGAAYCSACGAKLATENTADENGKASRTAFEKEKNAQRMRAELTELVLRTYRQVQPQTENYQNAIAIKQRIANEERALRENEKRNPKRNLKTAIMLLVASIPVFLFLMSIDQPPESPAYFVGQLLGAFMLASPLFIPAIILFFTCRSETREKEKTANSLCSSIQKDEIEAEKIATEIIVTTIQFQIISSISSMPTPGLCGPYTKLFLRAAPIRSRKQFSISTNSATGRKWKTSRYSS